MNSAQEAGLQKAVLVATGIVQPVVEALRQLTGAEVLLDGGEAARAESDELARGLDGWHWVIPIEITGVYNGAACVLVSQRLVSARGLASSDEGAERFASMTDEYLVRAGEKLGPVWGGAVSLDRLGLRRATPDSAPQILAAALGPANRDGQRAGRTGPGSIIAVRFPARPAGSGPDDTRKDVLALLGARLAEELLGTTSVGPGTTMPVQAASPRGGASDLIGRARELRVRASADVGGRTMTLGELERLAPGSAIDLGKNVADPLELRVQGRLVAAGDAVTLQRGFGFRVRYLGVR